MPPVIPSASASATPLEPAAAHVEAPSVRKQHLLQAAARVFGERGYKAATLRQIAEEAGILAGSVYHHVSSKEALYLEVHREGYLRMQAAVERALQGRTDPWERLEVACCTHLEEMLDGDAVAWVTGLGLMEPRDGPVHATLGLLRLHLLGALNWTRTWYRPDGRLRPADMAAQLIRMLR